MPGKQNTSTAFRGAKPKEGERTGRARGTDAKVTERDGSEVQRGRERDARSGRAEERDAEKRILAAAADTVTLPAAGLLAAFLATRPALITPTPAKISRY